MVRRNLNKYVYNMISKMKVVYSFIREYSITYCFCKFSKHRKVLPRDWCAGKLAPEEDLRSTNDDNADLGSNTHVHIWVFLRF